MMAPKLELDRYQQQTSCKQTKTAIERVEKVGGSNLALGCVIM